MLIKMKQTTPVSTTGLDSVVWEKGEVCDAPAELAKSLVEAGLAVLRKGEKLPEPEPEPEPEPKPKSALKKPFKVEVEESEDDSDGIVELDE